MEALCEAFNTDPYFKVRAYAGLSLLFQLLRGPSIQQTGSILSCSLQFLSTDLRHYFTKPVAADALQYQVVCPFIAGRLLLQAGILSLQGLQQNWDEGLLNLNRISEELEGNEALSDNLKNSWQYAKDAKVVATAVVKGNAGGVTRGGLARVPKHPVSGGEFSERNARGIGRPEILLAAVRINIVSNKPTYKSNKQHPHQVANVGDLGFGA